MRRRPADEPRGGRDLRWRRAMDHEHGGRRRRGARPWRRPHRPAGAVWRPAGL